jgi:hypothetical protein
MRVLALAERQESPLIEKDLQMQNIVAESSHD